MPHKNTNLAINKLYIDSKLKGKIDLTGFQVYSLAEVYFVVHIGIGSLTA